MKLIIDGYGKSVHKKDNQLIIKQKGEEIYRINIKKVSDITILGKGSITLDALTLIAKNNINVISLSYTGQVEYIIESPSKKDIKLRKKQYYASDDEKGLTLAKEFIKSKMKNQKATIRTLNKQKNIPEIKQKERNIDISIKELEKLDVKQDNIKNRIMGIEGKCSVEYWSAIALLLPENINFKKRNQKPNEDVVNSMLNYGYAILASQITKSIILNGLDPYCGFLHADKSGRTSLTFDFIEEFRQQIVDKTVFNLINNGQITELDVDKRNNSLKLETRKLLSSKILDKLYSKINYENKKVNYLEIINKQVEDVVLYLLENVTYSGFYLRW